MYRNIRAITLTGLLVIGAPGSILFAQDNTQQPPQTQNSEQSGGNMGAMNGPGMRHHMPDPAHQLKHLTRRLNLTGDQQNQLRPILVSRQQQADQLWQDKSLTRHDRMEKLRTLNQETHAKVTALLNDQQKQQFEQMLQHRQQMHERHMQEHNGGQQTPGAQSQQ